MRKKQIKRETTLPKIPGNGGRLKETERTVRGGTKDITGASQACIPSVRQRGRDVENGLKSSRLRATKTFVPVVDLNNKPLMPTSPARARKWIKSKKATGFWNHGIYCVRLNVEPSARNSQEICVGIDPGSKKEGYTVKSELHTYLNIQADAVTDVKDKVETRRNLRRSRRNRTTPCRTPRANRLCLTGGRVPPSTKARWGWKLRMFNWLKRMFPITHCVVEDIKAKTYKGARKWNKSFSPLEVGKAWFYEELRKQTILSTKTGQDTYELRQIMGLKKTSNKKSEVFEAHCVDSWVLTNSVVGGHMEPDNTNIVLVKPLRFYRRQLHVQNPLKCSIRKQYGGTISEGFKRGSLAVHPKYGLILIGGSSKERVSLNDLDGKRLTQNAKPSDIKFLAYNSITTNRQFLPRLKAQVSLP